ncbi:hypothetical protein BDQ12DRAFT_396590 [Crucibulum laeve]|uniref:F-box domain-containing protein n=1 Tax=Crucibulum laeve TaxID=68775 RepID=A0A5C3M949_9AGAR|nr:hypothetical protein BDQ12DRAFT_396590 [Crucibulum laeve]
MTGHFIMAPPPMPPPLSILPAGSMSLVLPQTPPTSHNTWELPSEQVEKPKSQSAMHWGHIAIFYLVQQMHRWERFIFQFDKQFTSMSALKSITGNAPLLKEFDISSSEPAFYAEWPWLPNASPTSNLELPSLKTLTLQYAPFKWNSPMLRTNLHTLNLRALPTGHLPLDRILSIIAANPALKELSLNFHGALPAILPLTPTPLPELETLTIGGHYLLSGLVDTLILPRLRSLTLDIDARESIEDIVTGMLTRSGKPAVEHLSVGYSPGNTSAHFYYSPGGMLVTSWTTLLRELPQLKTLQLGGTALEPLLGALSGPDSDAYSGPGQPAWAGWVCPILESLSLRNCHAHNDGVQRLVGMVGGRNNTGGGGGAGSGNTNTNGTPAQIKTLELYECTSLGADVIEWLSKHVEEVVCTEPTYER